MDKPTSKGFGQLSRFFWLPKQNWLRGVIAICIFTAAVQNCAPNLRPPFDTTDPEFFFSQTFGQLIFFNDQVLKPAHFMVLNMPAGESVRAFAMGTIRYEPDFQDLGAAIIFDPKDYFISRHTDFDELEGLPDADGVQFAFANLIDAEVRAAVESRYTHLNLISFWLRLQGYWPRKKEDIQHYRHRRLGTVFRRKKATSTLKRRMYPYPTARPHEFFDHTGNPG